MDGRAQHLIGNRLLIPNTLARIDLDGIVWKRKASPYRSGECRDWRKVKTQAWREANRERWRLFERA